jgi:hypothetical protein
MIQSQTLLQKLPRFQVPNSSPYLNVYRDPVAEAESFESTEAMDSVHIIKQVYYKRPIVTTPHSCLYQKVYVHRYNWVLF